MAHEVSEVPELLYVPTRGRSEVIRMLFCAAEIKFKNVFIREREEYLKLCEDGELLFDQVPRLKIDGETLVQGGAIARYVARKAGMLGNSNMETAKIEMVFDGTRDFMNGLFLFGFVEDAENITKTTVMPKWLPKFDKILSENGTGFLVGSSMTLADIGLLEPLLTIVDYFTEDGFKEYSAIQKFYKLMTADSRISYYQQNERLPKYNKELCDMVIHVFAMKIPSK